MADDDFVNTDRFKRFANGVRNDLLPKLNDSAVVMSLVPRHPEDLDVKYAVELGFSMMLDKPIVLLVHPGQELPDHLVRVADRIVEVDFDDHEQSQSRIKASIDDLRASGLLDG